MPSNQGYGPGVTVDPNTGIGYDARTGKYFIANPSATPAGEAGFGMHTLNTGVGPVVLQTAPGMFGAPRYTGVGSESAFGLPGVFPGTTAPPNPYLGSAVGLSGAFGFGDPYVMTPGIGQDFMQQWMANRSAAGAGGWANQLLGGAMGGMGGGGMMPGISGGAAMGGPMSGFGMAGGGGSPFPYGSPLNQQSMFGLQMGGAGNIIPGSMPALGGGGGYGSSGLTPTGLRAPTDVVAGDQASQAAQANWDALQAGVNAGAPTALPTSRAAELAARGPQPYLPGERQGPSAALGGQMDYDLMAQRLLATEGAQAPGYNPYVDPQWMNPAHPTFGSPQEFQAWAQGPGANPLLGPGDVNAGAGFGGGGSPSVMAGMGGAGGLGALGGGQLPAGPSTAGPFAPTPAGLGGNLLLNEIARREGFLNTSQGMQQQALQAMLGSPVAGGTVSALNELLSDPFPGSSDAMQAAGRQALTRRIGQASEGARASVGQQLTEQGLRGGEAAGVRAGTEFQSATVLANALQQFDQEMAQLRTQERGALMSGLGAGGQILRGNVYEPMMDVSSFYERRSNPEIAAFLQLLGQQEAANAALQTAQAAAGGMGGLAGSTAGAVTNAQLLQLLGLGGGGGGYVMPSGLGSNLPSRQTT